MLKDIRWPLVIAVLVFMLSIFYGFNYYQQKQKIDEPLSRQLLGLEAVRELEIRHTREAVLFFLELDPVEDLQKEEEVIQGEIEKVLEDRPYQLHYQDKRSRELEEVYYQVHYALYEAAGKGNYTEMSRVVGEIMEGLPVERYVLTVGKDNIYFQVHRGEHYLYEVVPRFPSRQEKPLRESDSFG